MSIENEHWTAQGNRLYGAPGQCIARFDGFDTTPQMDEDNARLAAAAPDMHRAIEALLDHIHTAKWDRPFYVQEGPSFDRAILNARDLLARANGRDK